MPLTGHQVTLVDDHERLGGILRLTDFDYFKRDLFNFKELLVREVAKRKSIEVRLNTTATLNSSAKSIPKPW